jgi:hypothetical protein
MLFILAMDVLGFLISKAESVGLLKPLSTRTLHHRVSYYADDMVLFLHPTTGDINIILYILQVFREASGLCNNVQNSSVYPIRCDDTKRVVVQQLLHCEVSDFPCHYIGLPLNKKTCNGSGSTNCGQICRSTAGLEGRSADQTG